MLVYPYEKAVSWRGDAKRVNRNCKDISVITLSSFREKAVYEGRRGLTTFKNMLFLYEEDALLAARGTSSVTQSVICWFVVCYEFGCWRCYILSVKMFRTMLCNDFLLPYWFFWNMEDYLLRFYEDVEQSSSLRSVSSCNVGWKVISRTVSRHFSINYVTQQ